MLLSIKEARRHGQQLPACARLSLKARWAAARTGARTAAHRRRVQGGIAAAARVARARRRRGVVGVAGVARPARLLRLLGQGRAAAAAPAQLPRACTQEVSPLENSKPHLCNTMPYDVTSSYESRLLQSGSAVVKPVHT